MTFWSDDTALDTLRIVTYEDISESLESDAENGLVSHLVDMSEVGMEFLCAEQLTERTIVYLHEPVVNDIFPDGEALSVVMVDTVLVLSPLAQNELRRLDHLVCNKPCEETDEEVGLVLMQFREIT